jgi:hypothetical protein
VNDSPTFEIDLKRAEALLHDLAAKLMRVPLGPRTREIHLRALGLKRQLTDWAKAQPEAGQLRDVIEELLALQQRAVESVRHPSGRILVCGRKAVRWNAA